MFGYFSVERPILPLSSDCEQFFWNGSFGNYYADDMTLSIKLWMAD